MPRPRSLPVPAAPRLPSAAQTLGRPPLIAGEDPARHATLLTRVTEAVRPDGIIEEAWVRDVVDLIWDAVRLRRLKAALMTHNGAAWMDRVLLGINARLPNPGKSRGWAPRDLAIPSEVDAVL